MKNTIEQDGIEFVLSKKTDLYLPSGLQKEIDYPIRTALKKAIKPALTTLVTAGILANALPVFANEKTQNHLFMGSILSEKNIDNIVDYKRKDGTKIIVEGITSPWTDQKTSVLNTAVKVPLHLFEQDIIVGNYLDLDLENDGWADTSIIEVKPLTELVLRAGSIFDSQGIEGAFMGGKYQHKYFTIDADAFHDGLKPDAHGYVAGLIPIKGLGKLYLSAGGKIGKENLNFLTGWIDPEGFGVFNNVNIDLANKTQSGKFLIVPEGSTYTRGTFEFRNGSVYTGAGMINEVTGYTPIGWAPFDAFAVDGKKGHCVISGKWNNNPNQTGGKLELLYRANPNIFFGVGPTYDYDKTQNEHNPGFVAEISTMVPHLPIETWAKLDANLRTGKLAPTVYAGLIKDF